MKYINGGYVADEGEHALLTGPIMGSVTLKDGTVYNVSDHAIGVHPEHVDEVAHLIGERYQAEGHPHHDDATPFVHEVSEQFADYAPHPDNTTLAG